MNAGDCTTFLPLASVAAMQGRMAVFHALGDTDAVAVGDYHLKNFVAYNLVGEPRASDERMLELLEPYRGQRARVIALLAASGRSAPKYGARQRILPMERW